MQDIQGTLELEVELKKLMNAFADRKTPAPYVRPVDFGNAWSKWDDWL